jgi:hypothetical protein
VGVGEVVLLVLVVSWVLRRDNPRHIASRQGKFWEFLARVLLHPVPLFPGVPIPAGIDAGDSLSAPGAVVVIRIPVEIPFAVQALAMGTMELVVLINAEGENGNPLVSITADSHSTPLSALMENITLSIPFLAYAAISADRACLMQVSNLFHVSAPWTSAGGTLPEQPRSHRYRPGRVSLCPP